MAPRDTPPSSPLRDDEEMAINENIEIVDLDEDFAVDDDDAVVMDENDPMLVPPKEDNSNLVFEKHESKFILWRLKSFI